MLIKRDIYCLNQCITCSNPTNVECDPRNRRVQTGHQTTGSHLRRSGRGHEVISVEHHSWIHRESVSTLSVTCLQYHNIQLHYQLRTVFMVLLKPANVGQHVFSNSAGQQMSDMCSKSWPTYYAVLRFWPFMNMFVLCWPTCG